MNGEMQVVIEPPHQAFRRTPGAGRRQPADRRRPDRRPDRSQRGRQVDPAPLRQRPEQLRPGRDPRRRTHAVAQPQPSRLSGRPSGPPATGHDLSGFPAFSAPDRPAKHHRGAPLRLEAQQGRGPGSGDAAVGPRGSGRPRRGLSPRAFRRSEAARGHCPGDGHGAPRPAVRRDHQRVGPGAEKRGAGRPGGPQTRRAHANHRHARDRLRPACGRSGRGAGRRQDHRGGHAQPGAGRSAGAPHPAVLQPNLCM